MTEFEHPSEKGQCARVAIGHIRQSSSYRIEKPFEILIETEPGQPETNVEFGLVENILARDARHHGLGRFSLDNHGFRFLQHDFGDDLDATALLGSNREVLLQAYLAKLQILVTEELAAEQVILYDWRVIALHCLCWYLHGLG